MSDFKRGDKLIGRGSHRHLRYWEPDNGVPNLHVLREALQDFMSYYDPKGGVSEVPKGPFERAEEVLG